MGILVARKSFTLNGIAIEPGMLVNEADCRAPHNLLNSKLVTRLDMTMVNQYDPDELKRAGAEVDKDVNPVDSVPDPRTEESAPTGVPNPNLTNLTPETNLAGEAYRSLAAGDVPEAGDTDAADTPPPDDLAPVEDVVGGDPSGTSAEDIEDAREDMVTATLPDANTDDEDDVNKSSRRSRR